MKRLWIVGLVVGVLLLSGCGSMEETAVPEPPADYVPVVSVTGEVVPAAWAEMSAQSGGMVLQVLIEPGDTVSAGQVLIQLDPTDAALAVQQAEGALAAAQAQLDALEAGPRAEEIAIAKAQLEAAQAALSQAVAMREQLSGTGMAAAQAQLAAALLEETAAHDAHQQFGSLLLYMQFQAAEAARIAAEMQVAEMAQDGAQRQVADAAVWAAAAQRDTAQAQLDILQNGATGAELAAVRAAVTQAEVALEAAQVALDRCEVRAPFAGTIGTVNVRVGEMVFPGQPLVTLGDLDTLRVETTDLDEIDVALVAVGQQADLAFDALPEQILTGQVVRVAPMAASDTGAVHYTVIIELAEIDPVIRWGMTAFVDIEVEN